MEFLCYTDEAESPWIHPPLQEREVIRSLDFGEDFTRMKHKRGDERRGEMLIQKVWEFGK